MRRKITIKCGMQKPYTKEELEKLNDTTTNTITNERA